MHRFVHWAKRFVTLSCLAAVRQPNTVERGQPPPPALVNKHGDAMSCSPLPGHMDARVCHIRWCCLTVRHQPATFRAHSSDYSRVIRCRCPPGANRDGRQGSSRLTVPVIAIPSCVPSTRHPDSVPPRRARWGPWNQLMLPPLREIFASSARRPEPPLRPIWICH